MIPDPCDWADALSDFGSLAKMLHHHKGASAIG